MPEGAPAASTTYAENVAATVAFMKESSSLQELFCRAVPLDGDRGYLLPVGRIHADDGHLISAISRWREANGYAFPTQFPVTEAGTQSWLTSRLLDVPDRLLFLVADRHGHAVGHLGIANALNDERSVEVDNVVRGEKGAEPGIMTAAMERLASWVEEQLSPDELFLRVFASNAHAVAFYERLGYVEIERTPLRREIDGDTLTYVATDGEADDEFVVMRLAPAPEFDGSTMVLTAGPSISAREAVYGFDAITTGWNDRWSVYLRRFQDSFADYVDVKYALATSSCTGALHIALAAYGIGPGDEVIVPEITWVATANAVKYVGADPVFADVDPMTWCLDPTSVEAMITPRTKAIMPVHLYGYPTDMTAICRIAADHGLLVVEDAAPAIGAEWDGRKLGSFGDAAGFSFQGAKLLVTGEGGMLVTSDDAFFDKASSLADQGRDPNRTFWINDVGLKYKMSNAQAAVGLGQLERVEHLIDRKRRVHEWYREALADVEGLTFQSEPPRGRSIHWMTSVVLSDELASSRDDVIESLRSRNVDTRPVFPAISQYPIWGKERAPQPVARSIGARGINLPSGVRLQRQVVEYVAMSLRQVIGA